MNWNSLKDIVDDFGLNSSSEDSSAVVAEVRSRMVKVHPDKTGGKFLDDEQKSSYNRLSHASKWLENHVNSTAMIPVNQLPMLIKTIGELQRPSHDERIGTLVRDTRAEAKITRQSRYGFPRIGSGAVAAIAGFLAAFPERFTKIMSPSVASSSFGNATNTVYLEHVEQLQRMLSLSFLMAALCAGIMFCLTWLYERRDEERTESAMSSATRENLFRRLVEQLRHEEQSYDFNAKQFVDIVGEYLGCDRARPFPFGGRLSPTVAEKIAQVHLEELEKRTAIEKIEAKSLYQGYRITPEAAREIT